MNVAYTKPFKKIASLLATHLFTKEATRDGVHAQHAVTVGAVIGDRDYKAPHAPRGTPEKASRRKGTISHPSLNVPQHNPKGRKLFKGHRP